MKALCASNSLYDLPHGILLHYKSHTFNYDYHPRRRALLEYPYIISISTLFSRKCYIVYGIDLTGTSSLSKLNHYLKCFIKNSSRFIDKTTSIATDSQFTFTL